MSKQAHKHVAIIGAGMGGLSAAIALAGAGLSVTLYEKEQRPGGKLRQMHPGGQALDAGPTVFTLKSVFEDLFAQAGLDFDARIPTQKADILARHVWAAGEVLDLYADPDCSADAIAAFAGDKDADGFQRFARQAALTFNTLDHGFMRRPAPSFTGLMRRAPMGDLLRSSPRKRLWGRLGDYFQDPRLRQLFGRYATYMGSSPFLAPDTLMLIAHAEAEGVWMVRDGMAALAQGLAQAAMDLGADLHLDRAVKSLDIKAGRVRGLILEDGDRVTADAVLFNGDLSALAYGHLGAEAQKAFGPYQPRTRSLSAMTWGIWGRAQGQALHRHTVFFGDAYKQEFDTLFDARQMPPDPTVYVCAQDRDDDCVGPDGPERLFCLINAPATGDRAAYDDAYGQQQFDRMTKRLTLGGLSIAAEPEHIATTHPGDFARLFPATGGALYGPATHGAFAPFSRAGVKTKIQGLYLAGGSVHPSAGVPMAALSGRMAAECILQD